LHNDAGLRRGAVPAEASVFRPRSSADFGWNWRTTGERDWPRKRRKSHLTRVASSARLRHDHAVQDAVALESRIAELVAAAARSSSNSSARPSTPLFGPG
jgi:hypothetical protein